MASLLMTFYSITDRETNIATNNRFNKIFQISAESQGSTLKKCRYVQVNDHTLKA